MTYTFSKVGGLVKLVIDDDAFTGDSTITQDRNNYAFSYKPFGATGVSFQFGGITGTIPDVDGVVTIEAVPITTFAEWETNIALVFPELGGGSGTTPEQVLEIVADWNEDNLLFTALIDLSSANFTITKGGVYEVTNEGNGSFKIDFPDPAAIKGEIVIVNPTAGAAPFFANANSPYTTGGAVQETEIESGAMKIYKSINGKWRGGFLAVSL